MKVKQIRFAAFGIATVALLPCFLHARQGQPESVADAARKARREHRVSAKPVTVFTNEDLASIKGTISVVGPAPAPAPASAASEKSEKLEKRAAAALPDDDKTPSVKGEAYWRKRFAQARRTLADDAHELDILQREHNLKEQQYYSDPNTAMREQYTRQDLNDTKTKIDEKTAAVAHEKQAISDLEDALRAAGGDPGWSRE